MGWRKDLCAVVIADHLRTDLSANQVVRNADFDAVIAAMPTPTSLCSS